MLLFFGVWQEIDAKLEPGDTRLMGRDALGDLGYVEEDMLPSLTWLLGMGLGMMRAMGGGK